MPKSGTTCRPPPSRRVYITVAVGTSHVPIGEGWLGLMPVLLVVGVARDPHPLRLQVRWTLTASSLPCPAG